MFFQKKAFVTLKSLAIFVLAPFFALSLVAALVTACAVTKSAQPRPATLEEFLGNWEGYWYDRMNFGSGGAKLRIVGLARSAVVIYYEITGDGPPRSGNYYAKFVEGKLVATFSTGDQNFSVSEISFYLQGDDELGGTYHVPRPKWYGVAIGYYVLKRKQ